MICEGYNKTVVTVHHLASTHKGTATTATYAFPYFSSCTIQKACISSFNPWKGNVFHQISPSNVIK
jgi:hypothetical protein